MQKEFKDSINVNGNLLINADCFDVFPFIEDKSIDAIICDLPYGTTACKWDTIIPFEPLWAQYKRIIKDNGAIVLFGSEPFSSALRMSNIKDYKYDWIWNKKLAGNGILAKKQPLKIHEIISVFNSKRYYPQMTKGKFRKKMGLKESEITGGDTFCNYTENDDYYPISIQEFSLAGVRTGRLHPTQKSLELLEYLVKTYTNEGDMVLDNTMGSGTTNLACLNLNRRSIGIEKEKKYYDIAVKRLVDNNKIVMNNETWNNFGYETDEKCCVCGKKPCKTEPRFGYSVCELHYKLSPIKISAINNSNKKKK